VTSATAGPAQSESIIAIAMPQCQTVPLMLPFNPTLLARITRRGSLAWLHTSSPPFAVHPQVGRL
jgi:hypothetical protein